jgi:hypothetical protein
LGAEAAPSDAELTTTQSGRNGLSRYRVGAKKRFSLNGVIFEKRGRGSLERGVSFRERLNDVWQHRAQA